ncbi:protein kinase domain-containing protein [Kibdelosporangium philippinense]|uniref:protein kinase domain-containing protein n=1 Tax=Kibdelosporangium philippinense TaxID=211113 RepID=UPI00361DA59C
MPGSPEYIAPERIDGHEATRAADMWAVGVTLYATVVGRSPFKRKDIQSTLAAAASRDPIPIRGLAVCGRSSRVCCVSSRPNGWRPMTRSSGSRLSRAA